MGGDSSSRVWLPEIIQLYFINRFHSGGVATYVKEVDYSVTRVLTDRGWWRGLAIPQ